MMLRFNYGGHLSEVDVVLTSFAPEPASAFLELVVFIALRSRQVYAAC
jgi:hypothetical protein